MFCIQNANDPVIPLVNELVAKYPTIDTKVFIGEYKNSNHALCDRLVMAPLLSRRAVTNLRAAASPRSARLRGTLLLSHPHSRVILRSHRKTT